MPDLAAILEEGERLCREATPGPFEADKHGVVRAGPLRQYARGSGRSQFAAVMMVGVSDETAEQMVLRRDADTALVALALNHLPLLLRLARAGAEMRRHGEAVVGRIVTLGIVTEGDFARFRAALAAWDAAASGEEKP